MKISRRKFLKESVVGVALSLVPDVATAKNTGPGITLPAPDKTVHAGK